MKGFHKLSSKAIYNRHSSVCFFKRNNAMLTTYIPVVNWFAEIQSSANAENSYSVLWKKLLWTCKHFLLFTVYYVWLKNCGHSMQSRKGQGRQRAKLGQCLSVSNGIHLPVSLFDWTNWDWGSKQGLEIAKRYGKLPKLLRHTYRLLMTHLCITAQWLAIADRVFPVTYYRKALYMASGSCPVCLESYC